MSTDCRSTEQKSWAVLGLDLPDSATAHSTKTIKRAYAKALKLIDQSADPEGFQVLREAYIHALEWVKVQQQDDLSQSSEMSVIDTESIEVATPEVQVQNEYLFNGDKAPPTADEGEQYANYVRMLDGAMDVDSEEDDWMNLLNDLDGESPELREDVEMMIFRTLLDTQRSDNSDACLPTSFTADVVNELDDQFQWLSDGVGFHRKFRGAADIMVVALNSVRGRETTFSKILQKPNWLIVSLMLVVLYAIMRTFVDWLTAMGVIS